MDAPRISILLPVHNGERVLATAVESILAQSLSAFELIIVDDGSVDGTEQLLAQIGEADPRVVHLRHPRCLGIVEALGTAVSAARGELFARMDADDVSRPRRLELQERFLTRHPGIGLVGCRVAFGGDAQAQAGYAAYVDWTNSLLDPDAISLSRFVESPFSHPSVMFRRDVLEQFGGYRDGAFPEDYELWLRWLDRGVRMAKLPEVLLDWSDPPTRLSRVDPRYSVRAFYTCKARYLARWLAGNNPHHPDVVIWGAGRETRKRAEMLVSHGIRISAYVDVDPRKIGQTIHGRPVWAEADLPGPGRRFVVSYVGSRGARADIRKRLATRGYVEGRHAIMAA